MQPCRSRHIPRLPIRRKSKCMRSLLAKNDHILKTIVVQVAHQTISISRSRHSRQQLTSRFESSALVVQQSEAILSLHYEQAVPPVMVVIQHGHRSTELRRTLTERFGSCVHETY